MDTFFAHSGNDRDGFSDYQLLREHLERVAQLARGLARAARQGDEGLAGAAYAAGLLHDLGKYRPEFQRHIRGLPVQRELTYHRQAGAVRGVAHPPLALAILGHHGGIPDFDELRKAVRSEQHGQALAERIWPVARQDCPALGEVTLPPFRPASTLDADLTTRLLFSCLVDADWTDTGEYTRGVRGQAGEPPAPAFSPGVWLPRVEAFVAGRAIACQDPRVGAVRADILGVCRAAADLPPGLFTLTVPTGGGKTLSGLVFALRHAALHGLRRLIYVAPYLTILEQNAWVIRQALGLGEGDPAVYEHHSLADPAGDGEEELGREAAVRRAENWDAPVVLTSNVQFFESLFANRPSRCRKLHNVARSVILLDECQTVPPGLVAPTCAMLRQVADSLGSTVVLCTATQPAFAHPRLKPEERVEAREIIPQDLDLFRRLRRVRLSWPSGPEERLDWAEVAGRICRHRAALAVVNTRKSARELFLEVRKHRPAEEVYHLSTSMCPAHRLEVLDKVRTMLLSKKPCFLVSTQLIEAGVDVDFPHVLREIGPLESILQAAGRCNREGLLNGPDGSPGGVVEVFRGPDDVMPPGWYKAGCQVVETDFLRAGSLPSIDRPEDIQEYFARLYPRGELDKEGIQKLRGEFSFRTVAEKYRIIEEDTAPVVAMTWEAYRAEIERQVEAVREAPSRSAFRRLVPFQVQLRRYELAKFTASVVEADPRFDLLLWHGTYDPELGLGPDLPDLLPV